MKSRDENIQHKTVALHTLGCRLNFSETGSIAGGFAQRGYKIVEFGERADVTFINTCTVTDKADSTCRNLIRKAHRTSPEGKVVVAGCYAQMEAEAISKMTGVDLILGTQEKYKVFDYLDEDEELGIHIEKENEFWEASTTPEDTHTRAFLKIQDGCNYICSFCIIPFARGRSRAMPIADALRQAREVVANGFKEIVLTGVNIGEYESNTGEKLADLVQGLCEVEGLKRLRISSVEPNTFSDELLEVMAKNSKCLDHFHIPLQSGDDNILKDMKRKYSVADYKAVVEKIQKYYPNASFGADMIVGFPGETEEQFANTMKLAKELPLTHFHVFPYSQRKNTVAAKMPDHIQHKVKKRRAEMLRMLGDAKLNHLAESMVDTVSEVLFERENEHGFFEGYASNYVKVYMESKIDLKNEILPVRFIQSDRGSLLGKIIH